MAKLFGVFPERVSDFVEFDIGNAIKVTLFRVRPSGSPGNWDILDCQRYTPFGGYRSDLELAPTPGS
jgi:hypothetical protein